MPHFEASTLHDLSLHCLPVFHRNDNGVIWFNVESKSEQRQSCMQSGWGISYASYMFIQILAMLGSLGSRLLTQGTKIPLVLVITGEI